MKVSVNQKRCTGAGMCEAVAPRVFVMHDDGLAYVRVDGTSAGTDGSNAQAIVPLDLQLDVEDAAAGCPGGAIDIQQG